MTDESNQKIKTAESAKLKTKTKAELDDDESNPLLAMWKANGEPNPLITFGAKNKQEEDDMMAAAEAQEEEAKMKYANVKWENKPKIREMFGDEYGEKHHTCFVQRND